MELIRHGDGQRGAITVGAARSGNQLKLEYRAADVATLRLTDHPPGRTDGLWRHTCFEAFVAGAGVGAGPAYHEFNFAPSGAWAAYAFEGYRTGMRYADAAPAISWQDGMLAATVEVPVAGDWALNLTAVIERLDGSRSYWALAHPAGPPDFHARDCFVLTLPAVG